MRESQKKNCNGCKASIFHAAPARHTCQFGKQVDTENYDGIPQEPCLKPLTNNDWSTVMQMKRKK